MVWIGLDLGFTPSWVSKPLGSPRKLQIICGSLSPGWQPEFPEFENDTMGRSFPRNKAPPAEKKRRAEKRRECLAFFCVDWGYGLRWCRISSMHSIGVLWGSGWNVLVQPTRGYVRYSLTHSNLTGRCLGGHSEANAQSKQWANTHKGNSLDGLSCLVVFPCIYYLKQSFEGAVEFLTI